MATRNLANKNFHARQEGSDHLADAIRGASMAAPDNHFHEAAEYLDRGWSVIPLIGKRPAIPWSKYQSRRATFDEIRKWFCPTTYAQHNVGVVTGSVSGLVVVDCDTHAAASWWKEHFPATPLASTTGRGEHMYYQIADSATVRNRAGILDRDIDIRGEGGYVVAPPSRHPDTGTLYTWAPWDHYSLGEIPVFDPSWIVPATEEQRESHLRPADSLKPSPTSRDILGLARRLDLEVADRSARDFAIVCELLRAEISEAEIHTLVMDRSKFKTNGDDYFRRTYENAKRAVGC